MKHLILCALVACTSLAKAQDMPELNTTKAAILSAPYSCNGSYSRSALFISQYAKARNSPDLLYNGSCSSKNYIEAETVVGDKALIADMGPISLEEALASQKLDWNVLARFAPIQPVIWNHTYVVITSKPEIRSVYAFTVLSHKPDGELIIAYAVKSYETRKR